MGSGKRRVYISPKRRKQYGEDDGRRISKGKGEADERAFAEGEGLDEEINYRGEGIEEGDELLMGKGPQLAEEGLGAGGCKLMKETTNFCRDGWKKNF